MVISKAVQAIGFFAKGLRADFSRDGKQLLPTLLGKFKEKKAAVVTAIHETLDQLMDICFSLSDIPEGTLHIN